jgi:hypothetical protein
VIVAERAQAHDFDVTVGFDGEIGLDPEGDLDAGGILRINADVVDAPDLGTSRVTNAGAGLDTSSEWEIGAISVRGSSEGAANGKNGTNQNSGGDDNEQTDKRLFAFRIHGFPSLLEQSSGATATILG